MSYYHTFWVNLKNYLINIDLMDDEEDVLISLAEILGSFLEYSGGPSHAVHVLKPLEKLC
jgi:serine/threonine-protein phosphatase 2A regulatory subunit A